MKNLKSVNNMKLFKSKSIEEIREFAENIVNTVREPLLILDRDLRVVKASRSFFDFFKVNVDETIGKLIYQLGNNQWDIPKLRELLETILPEKTAFDNYEVEHDFSTIGKRIMLLNARQIKRAFGKEKIILLAIEDITERKREEKTLSETNRLTQEYLDILFDHANVPSIIWDTSFVIKYINHAFEKLSGYDWTEVTDKKIDILFPENKVDSAMALIKGALQSDENMGGTEVDILTKNKDIKTVLWNPKNILDKAGNRIVATIAQDITAQKRSEIFLRESEEKYRSFFENSLDAILLTSPDGKIFSANPAACKTFGYSEEELIKLGRSGVVDMTDPQLPVLLAERALKGKVQGELTFVRKDGTHFLADISSAIFKDNKGLERTSMIIRDITDRKKAEQKVRESERRFRAIIDQAPLSIALLDMEGHPVISNLCLSNMLGYSSDELSKMKFVDFTYPEDVEEDLNQFNDLISGKITRYSMEKRFVHKYGNLVWVNLLVTMLRGENGIPREIIGMAEDITGRKNKEKEIKESEEKFRIITENSADPIFIANSSGRYLYVNTKAVQMLGYSKEEMLSFTIADISPQRKVREYFQIFRQLLKEGSSFTEVELVKKDGKILPTDFNAVLLPNGFVYASCRDITERKRAEKELIEAKEKAEESDKLKSEFLAQMSHEIRTPINILLGNVDYLNDLLAEKKDSGASDCFDSIKVASRRIIRTIDLILNISELQTSGYKPVFVKIDLDSEILKKLYRENQLYATQAGLEIIYTCNEKDTKVIADEYSVTKIFSNLIENAIKFTKKGKVEILIMKNKTGNIIVEIKDTGIGISKEFLPKVFKLFVQEEHGYSRSFDGNGLGLSLVKNYCDINKAIIEVESEKNVGSTFRVIFS